MFIDLVRNRRSCRSYDPARPVPGQLVIECLEAARLAPSACNRQPWRFIIVDDRETRLQICGKCLLPGLSHAWLHDAPTIVVLCVELDLVTHRIAPVVSGVPYYLIDAGIAGEHFVLAATDRGLGTCWIGWFKERAVRRLLGIPRNVKIASLISLGYPGKDFQPGPRHLRSMQEIRNHNRWHKG